MSMKCPELAELVCITVHRIVLYKTVLGCSTCIKMSVGSNSLRLTSGYGTMIIRLFSPPGDGSLSDPEIQIFITSGYNTVRKPYI